MPNKPLPCAADQITALFRRTAPEQADTAAPFVAKLFQALENGHSFIRVSAEERQQLLQAAPLVAADASAPLVLNGQHLFTARYWQLEHALADEIRRLSPPPELPPQAELCARLLQQWFAEPSARDQQAAAALTLINRFTLISGGPGTGKTTTVAKLLALLCQTAADIPQIALAAPTGKAAARLSEALKQALARIPELPAATAAALSGLEGQTVHRLLGLLPPQMQPYYHRDNRLPLEILIIDEASMLDSHLLQQLLSALPDRCRVILLGDDRQLPPVEAGAVLQALTEADTPLSEHDHALLQQLLPNGWDDTLSLHHARLRISHRFGSDSGIGQLAQAVTAGDAAGAWQQFARFPDALMLRQGTAEQQAQTFYQAQQPYWQAVERGDVAAAFRHQGELAVLAVRRRDARRFQAAYLSVLQQHGRAPADGSWFAGQQLIVSRNDPDNRLFNGDVGIVLPHPSEKQRLAAWFPEQASGWRAVALSRLPACEDAAAITVHKSQGSEYGEVWLLAPDGGEYGDFSRALLYTAITRAKQRFAYWGGEAAFQAACQRNIRRRTALAEYLQAHLADTLPENPA